jgi:hypothetical protein
VTQEELWRELGCPKRPARIWQKAFDFDPLHCEQLCDLCQSAATPPGRRGPADFELYIDDLTYEETQMDLLLYLLPLCLRAWSMNFLGETAWFHTYGEMFWRPWGSINEYRTEALFDRLSAPQQQAFQRYVIDCILEAIDRSPGLQAIDRSPRLPGLERSIPQAYCDRWIREIASFATICPGLSMLWNKWWNLETQGRAIAALQYISCLMYEESANRIFGPSTPASGGGPPRLWDDYMDVNNRAWHPANVRFLESVLIPGELASAIDRCHLRLTDPEDLAIAARMKADFSAQGTLLELRIERLLAILAAPGYGRSEWTI